MSAQDQSGEESPRQVQLAEFRIVGPGDAGEPIDVHFNPETLEYTVTNNIKEQGNSTESKQQVSKSSGKLSMELQFDTTLDGSDVREKTEQLQALMKPAEEGGKKIAPVVEFAWGTYRFKGIFTSYKETLDFFSSTGVPLRASISITMTQQDGLFDPSAKGDPVNVDDSEAFEPVTDPDDPDNDNRGPATGDPETDRALAEDNDEDNPRFFSGNPLSLPGGPDLKPPAAFASAGLSLGASAGLDIGLDVGFSAGVSAGIGIGLGIEAGIDVGLSAGFELDIGLDVQFEASIDVSVGASASVSGGGDAAAEIDTGPAAGGGATTTATSTPSGPAGTTLTATTDEAPADSLAGAFTFVSGEFARSGTGPASVAASPRGFDATDAPAPVGPLYGSQASAGVPAAFGAFAGLRRIRPRRRRPVLLSQLKGRRPERNLRTDTGASFEVGGRALDRSAGGLGADVGARASIDDRISFDDPSPTEG